ncbi:MAG: hypothetical protein AMJ69_08750 [Gammaproteobacteria bacterium SG8_47]|nr:MAG: hypothetical protein AMJ69_08750 [Gammaproteobacteria bacterium SG8_47]
MAIWQRLLITVLAVLAASFLAGLLWQQWFNVRLPSYVSGVIGGFAAIPTWEFTRRIGPSSGRGDTHKPVD